MLDVGQDQIEAFVTQCIIECGGTTGPSGLSCGWVDLGLDSLAFAEFCEMVEERFNTAVEWDRVAPPGQVNDLVELLLVSAR
jgi:Phosphopantetheine attachment site